MPSPRFPTAVLLFSLPTALDAARKGLAGPRISRNQAFWKTLCQLTTAKVEAAGLPCVFSANILPAPDYSASFGEQLQAAVSATLAQGYERVIVIGNDCPDLRIDDLRAAADALARGRLPVGYDRRGGVYLLGLDRRFLLVQTEQKNAPGSPSFGTLPWQTNQLGAALTEYLGCAFGDVAGLSAVRADWNERADLRAGDWLRGALAGLARRLWVLIAPIRNLFASFDSPVQLSARRTVCLRAPPVAA